MWRGSTASQVFGRDAVWRMARRERTRSDRRECMSEPLEVKQLGKTAGERSERLTARVYRTFRGEPDASSRVHTSTTKWGWKRPRRKASAPGSPNRYT